MNTIKQIRLEMGLTQKGLAKLLGITAACVSNYENGFRSLPIEIAKLYVSLSKKKGNKLTLEDIYA